MTFQMHETDRLSIEQMREFLQGSRRIEFTLEGRAAAYAFLVRVLQRQRYAQLSRPERGVIRQYLIKLTGLSRAQITRLIRRWCETRQLQPLPPQRSSFPRRYRSTDIALLAQVDAAHEDLSGPAIRRILKREYTVYQKPEFERLAGLSVSHLYNLRRSVAYRRRRVRVQTRRGTAVSIAERRRPDPRGQPGYLRVDTVHQGRQDGQAGPYHINSVDTVTQWEVVGCCAAISENHLVPVLQEILAQYPFRILGFHSDNGSEYLNYRVAEMLNKLLTEFTKSRPCRATDNALVEGKNGAVVRKHMGYGLIGSEWAGQIHRFYAEFLNPYLNFHRPCGFATVVVNQRGQRRRHYRADDYRTPYEKLTSLLKWEKYLKCGITASSLNQLAHEHSDTAAAELMQEAKIALLAQARSQRAGDGAPHVSPLLIGARGLKRRPLAPYPPPPLHKTNRKEKPATGHPRL
jgi:hypothetical protein